jgi:hypothetical protein
MTYSAKLSLMSTYRIRKILLVNQYKIMISQNFITESQIDLDKILNNLYPEKSKIEYQINQLETLARMYQILVEQKAISGIKEIEIHIFNILGLK